jgi:hypothetical protein
MLRHLLFALAIVVPVTEPLSAQGTAPEPSAASPAAAEAPNDYTSDQAWLCRPGRNDACAIDHTTTVVAADGTITREIWAADPQAPVDCFYVYPTISTDPGAQSDMTADAAERNVVAQQFARFASTCRPFAPLYRQVTLAGLRQRLAGGAIDLGRGLAYADVRDAWRDYLARDNRGRGVVLVGHSQGAFVLAELIRQEIDGKPVQRQLVSALLLGTTVTVPRGKDVGGSFQSVPACRSASHVGCVISYATYRSTIPPPANALFGRVVEPGQVAVCTNPVTFGDASGQLHAYLSASGRTITTQQAQLPWTARGTVETPWVSVPGLLSARCATNEHATFLEITVHGNPADPRVDDIAGDIGPPGKPSANWGLHLIDVNLAMGDLLRVVGQQATAWTARRP